MLNTIILTVSVVLLSVILGLVLAVLLDRKFVGRGLARTLLISRVTAAMAGIAHVAMRCALIRR